MPDFDVSGDFAVFDLIESVTLVKTRPDGKTTSYGGISALGRATLETVQEPGGALTVVRKVTWHIEAGTLPSDVVPDRDDRIVSDSTRLAGTYLVLTANLETAGTRYNCPSQQWMSAS